MITLIQDRPLQAEELEEYNELRDVILKHANTMHGLPVVSILSFLAGVVASGAPLQAQAVLFDAMKQNYQRGVAEGNRSVAIVEAEDEVAVLKGKLN